MSALYGRASELLDAAHDSLGSESPARRFVTVGPAVSEPSDNCVEQLTVTIVRVDMSRFGDRNTCAVAIRPVLQLELVRCVTAIDRDHQIPDAPLLAEEAAGLYTDAVNLLNGVTTRQFTGELFPGLDCETVTFGSLLPQGPFGGRAGWRWDINLSSLT